MSDAIHIVKIEVRNSHRLSVAQCDFIPGKGLVVVTGLNASGKTALLQSAKGAIGGGKQVLPRTLKDGEQSGYTMVELDNGYVITKKFSETHPKGVLTVVSPEGGKFGQSKINEWLGDASFDLLAILDLKPADLRDVLLSIATDPDLPKNLAALKADRQATYDQRTPHISRAQVATRIQKPDGDRPEAVDVSAEMERLQELQAKQAERKGKQDALVDLAAEVTYHNLLVEDALQQIARLQGIIGEEEARAEEAETVLAEAQVELNGLPDPAEDLLQVSARLSDANDINDQLEPWKTWDTAKADAEDAQISIDNLTEKIADIDAAQQQLLQHSGIPVENLSFAEDGEPLLNGLPIAVASGRERIDMAVNIAFAVDPDLRVCFLDEEGNSLDNDSLERLHQRAIAKDFQIFIARISKEGGGEIVVEDGVAKSAVETEKEGL